MDATSLETEALAAISGASSAVELEKARVHYLGRKSELAQALRAVRDRETGITLNGVRDALTFYTRPLTGAYYFVPSIQGIKQYMEQ